MKSPKNIGVTSVHVNGVKPKTKDKCKVKKKTVVNAKLGSTKSDYIESFVNYIDIQPLPLMR